MVNWPLEDQLTPSSHVGTLFSISLHGVLDMLFYSSVPVDRNLIRALCALIHILSQRLLPRLLLCAASL